MVLVNNDLTVEIDNSDGIFTAGKSVSGNARIGVKKPHKIEEIQARLICAIEVKIEEGDQENKKIAHNVKHKTKILDQEQLLLTTSQYLDPGVHEFPFEFVLTQLPPTYSYKLSKDTYGTIKHYVKVHVKKSGNSMLKMFNADARRYFTYVPSENIPPHLAPKERSFLAEISSKGGGKIVQSLDASAAGIDAFRRYTRIPIVSSGLIALSGLLKISGNLGRKSNKVLLACGINAPTGLKQDQATTFSLNVSTANEEETIMLRTVSIKLHKFQVLKFDQFIHESVIETTGLFHKVLLKEGTNITIPGTLEFEKSTLPSFSTDYFSHHHKIEVNMEISHISDGRIQPRSEVIELLPTHIYSFINDTRSSPGDAPVSDYSRFIADSNTGIPLTGYQTDAVCPDYGDIDRDPSPVPPLDPYMPDIDYRSRSNSVAEGTEIDEKKEAQSVPSGYPVDAKEDLPSYDASK